MNDARIRRRVRLLCEMFVELQASWLGKDTPASVNDRTVGTMSGHMKAHDASFDEIKDALRFVYLVQCGYWAENLADVRGFCNAYETICDQLDKHFDRGGAAVSSKVRHIDTAREGANHIAISKATPDQLANHQPLRAEHEPGLKLLRDSHKPQQPTGDDAA